MEYIIIISLVSSGILAYFLKKSNVKPTLNILIEGATIITLLIPLYFAEFKETSLLLYIFLTGMYILGIIARFVLPVIINTITYIITTITKQPYEKASYSSLFNDGHRLYFAALLNLTIKLELVFLYIGSLLNII